MDAAVEGTPASATFAITTAPADSMPALSADDARAAAAAKYFSSAIEDENLRLYGPLLLPAGSIVMSADSPSGPVTLSSMSWFFWLDQSPQDKSIHPSQSILLDAT